MSIKAEWTNEDALTLSQSTEAVLNDVSEKFDKLIYSKTGYSMNPDVVCVVRCKDCKHSRTNKDDDEDIYYCERTIGRAFHSCDFCSGGERRNDGEKKEIEKFDFVTTSTDLPMQEIEVPKYDGEIFINETGVASDAIFWR